MGLQGTALRAARGAVNSQSFEVRRNPRAPGVDYSKPFLNISLRQKY